MREDKFSFGPFVVDPRTLIVVRPSGEKQIEPRHMQLLCLLAAHSNELLTRAQISEVLWPQVVVGDDNITNAIFALRAILGDDARKPKYIQTVPKKGYRFLADVDYLPASKKSLTLAFIQKRWLYLSALCLCALTLFAFLTLTWSGNQADSLPLGTLKLGQVKPFTYQDGGEISLAMNVSGDALAYIHKKDGQFDIYTKGLDSDKPERWTEDGRRKSALQWLDATTVIFIRCVYTPERECQIVSQARGGSETIWYRSKRMLRHLAEFSRSERRWVFVEQVNPERMELKELNLRERRVIGWRETLPGLPNKMIFPRVTKNQDHILLINTEGEKQRLMQFDLSTKKSQTFKYDFEHIQYFVNVNEHFGVVSGQMGSRRGVWLLNYRQQESHLLLPSVSDEIIDSLYVDVSRKTLYYSSVRDNSDIIEYAADGSVTGATQGLNSSYSDYYPVADPLRDYVYFFSNRSGAHELWRFNTQERVSEQLTELNATALARPLVSPNGQFVALTAKTTELQLLVVDVVLNTIVAKKGLSQMQFLLSWSKDSQFFYTTEYDPKGKVRRYQATNLHIDKPYNFATPFYREINGVHRVVYADWRTNLIWEHNKSEDIKKSIYHASYPLKRLRPEKIHLYGNNLYLAQKEAGNQHESLYRYTTDAAKPTSSLMVGEKIVAFSIGEEVSDIRGDGNRILVTKKHNATGDIVKAKLSISSDIFRAATTAR